MTAATRRAKERSSSERLKNWTRNDFGVFRTTEAESRPEWLPRRLKRRSCRLRYFAIRYVGSPASFFADSILMRCFLAAVER